MSFKKLNALIFVILVNAMLVFAGCGGGGSEGGGGSSGGPSNTPTGQISIYNQNPTFRTSFTTNSSPVTISGMGSGPIGFITWENTTTGQSGNGTGDTSWSVDVPLQEGDNVINITAAPQTFSSAAADGSVTVNLTVTYNTSVNFTSLVQLTPDTGLVNDLYDAVYVRVGIDNTDLDPASVQLFNVDASGNKDGAAQATLTDDGDLNNGDEIQGDGIYSAKLSFTPAAAGPLNMRIFASDTSAKESKTSVFSFKAFDKPSQAQLDEQALNNESAADEFDDLINFKMTTLGLSKAEAAVASIDEMVTYLQGLDGVIDAGKGAYGVWWLNETGIFCVLSTTPDEGEVDESYALAENDDIREDPESFNSRPDSFGYDEKSTKVEYLSAGSAFPGFAATAVGDEQYNIGSLAALHIMPFQHTISWYKTKYPGGWYSIVEASECPAFTTIDMINELHDPMTSGVTEPVPLSVWKSLSNYGLISSATHGDSFDVAKDALEQKYPPLAYIDWLFPWHNERPILHTNIAIDFTLGDLAPYIADILAGRIMLWPSSGNKVKLVITPEFISYYNGTFPNTIWINISCRGAWNDALGAAFIAKGGGAWYGYSDYVKATYAHYTEKEILEQLVNQGKTAKEAFDAAVAAQGANDGDSDPAALVLLGEHQTKIGVTDLKNGSFEEPDGAGSLNGWIKAGDGRAIKILGSDLPTDGGTMSVISSGLGFTVDYGTISQSFCFPADAQSLQFDWNFYSEEFKEYCGSIFDDTFLVTITDIKAGTTSELFRTSVNILCGNSGALIQAPISFDIGDVWYTGWNYDENIDISDYQGKGVILDFFIEDKGDQIYDTAVLIDNIRIITP